MSRSALRNLTLSLGVFLGIAPAVQAETYQMLVPFPTNHALNTVADIFAKMVDERFDGKHKITIVGEAAIPGFEQFDPVASGVFPMALTAGPYHTGTTGVGLAADAIDADPEKRRNAGVWQAYQDYYLTHGLRMISFPSASPAYHFMMKQPIGEDGGFKGKIIRGTKTYHGPIIAFGGSPAVMPVSEIYSAAERGVIDGAGHTIFGNYQLKLHEVLPHLARPGFGVSSLMIMVNDGAWSKISPEDQKVFLEIGEELERVSLKHFEDLTNKETVLMEQVGAKVTEFGPEQRQKLEAAYANGLWEEAIKISGQNAEKIRKIAKDAGLTP